MAEQGSGQSTGLAPNVASLLCYICTFITGIVFLIVEKDNRDVRFHAWQAIIFGIAMLVVQIALSILGAILGAVASVLGAIIAILAPVVWLVFFIFWVICMIKAYQGERYKLPILGDMAEKQAAK
ncbi:MAG: DUF4870 domain-containing protein [Deltaproteobacteria bacterium]|nr:DUF4870 domain-containing protein [Deltaproteobacteria bacterium]